MTINEVEEKSVVAVLDSKSVTDADEHFFYNKEYWYKRVRMPPRKADEACENLLAVAEFLEKSEIFKEYATKELIKFIREWAKRCQHGRYEDLPDVEMYTHDGYDCDGLDLWIRHRGSKAENFHQKMIAACGPWMFGVEKSHYLQVLLAYFYNINAGITRCHEPDFGHFMLHLEDRIQSRMQQLWGVDLFKNRINLLDHEIDLDFVAVGVAPLSLNEDYVTKGKPAEGLSNDLHFMAERMRVEYPPLPPSSKREFGMIKSFLRDHPQHKVADVQRLCKMFKAQSNGNDVWPKLPTMIGPAIRRWTINQQIALLKLQSGQSYTEFFNKLKSKKIKLPPPTNPRVDKRKTKPVVESQREASNETTQVEVSSAPSRLSRPHVPPLCAPAQSVFVNGSVNASEAHKLNCAWWPICKKGRKDCGGARKELCAIYGVKGAKERPTKDELSRQIRIHSWTDKQKNMDCAWHPFCKTKQVVCGGQRGAWCSRYGTHGSHRHEAPSGEILKQAKKAAKAQKRRDRADK